ncbi:azurin [Shewanella salipaludis]|uniref:Azurin n=1 Tax=Shewanella salipaludis TaxID=2723052 RepID=A0A972JJS4_9GAMM|nr:azurin [Shewanella salipaludis]NMH66428.1 azurin [Shewanella salipaludis]
MNNSKITNLLRGVVALGLLLGISAHASANECELAIGANDAMQYDKKALSVPASCTEVTLTLTHTGSLPKTAMGHNWVLSKAEDMAAIANDGMTAGPEHNFIVDADTRVLAHTSLVGGGESASVTFSTEGMTQEQAYNFFCSFPGHWTLMQGSFSITP